jgi:hypothetical protein
MWDNLEIAKLLVSAVTPLVVLLIGSRINRSLKQLEERQWSNQKVVEKRLEIYDELAPLLNDLLCYFTYVGNWKELSPPEIVALKRTLDKKGYINAPLFSEQFSGRYWDFINVCFEVFTGWGEDAKLRTGTALRKDVAQVHWKPEWDRYFTAPDSVSDPTEVKGNYDALMEAFAQELGVGLVLERVTYSGRSI